MARTNRNYNPTTNLYHIIIRGIGQQDIFYDDQDRNKFLKELKNTKEQYKYEICAYCLMTNHVHLVMYDKEQNLSKAMQSLTVRYVSYFNKKYERVGNLVQDRFFSRNIVNKLYFLNVCRYIHQNPSKAKIAKMEEYKWSSYQDFLGKLYDDRNNIVNTKLLLNIFSKEDNKNAVEQYIEFHKKTEEFLDGKDIVEYEMRDRLSDEELRKIILNMLQIENFDEIKKYSLEIKKKMIRKLKDVKGTSFRQISRVTGISRKTVERYMQK